MRKIFSVVIVLLIVTNLFALTSCNSSKETASTVTTQTSQIKPEEKIKEHIVRMGERSENLYYIALPASEYATHFLVYDSALDELCFEYYEADKCLDKPQTDNANISFSVKINCVTDVVRCYTNTGKYSVYQGSGKLDKRRFGESMLSQLTDMQIIGHDTFTAGLWKETFSYRAHMMLLYWSLKLEEWALGVSLKDLGYAHF